MKIIYWCYFMVFLFPVSGQDLINQDTLIAKSDVEYKFPEAKGWVNDFDDILTNKQEKKLSEIISKFEKKTSNEIAIVTVAEIGPYSDIADYSTDLFNYWGIGKKDKDNG